MRTSIIAGAVALLSILTLVASTGQVAAQELPVQLDVDQSSFAYTGDQSLLEIYLAIEARSLDYVAKDSAFEAALPLDVSLRHNTDALLPGTPDEPVWADSVLLRFQLPDTSSLAPGQHFVHQLRTAVAPGEYELSVRVPKNEALNRPELELRREVNVPDFSAANGVTVSDVTLASAIVQSQQPESDRESPFYKNGLIIRPNANQLYGEGLPNVYFYAEVYNPATAAGDDDEYTVFAYVAEANRPQPLPDLQERLTRSVRSPDVIVDAFDISSLPSGSYFLRIAVLDDENESMVEQSRKFFVYNPSVQVEQGPPAVDVSFESSPYASMSEDEVEQSFKHIEIIAGDRERRRMKTLTDMDERRRFLMEFWQNRDPQPQTPINEFKEEFYRRLQYANDRYTNSRLEGWETDRGRVILKYGVPSAVEPRLYSRELLPHEIWQYNNIPGEGQAVFVFADLTGFGRFELIHSTVSGELHNPTWIDELRISN